MSVPTLAVAVVVIAVLVVVAIVVGLLRRSPDRQYKAHYGEEYDRLVGEKGSDSAARQELAAREQRVQGFHIHPADPEQWAGFARSWQEVQAEFVEDPSRSVNDADRLVGQLMETEGYPAADFDQRAADLSVEHPQAVADYRKAHEIAMSDGAGDCRTEDLREALISYRSTFDDLLGKEPSQARR